MLKLAIAIAALALTAACAEPYANDPMRQGWYAECDYEAQKATASNPVMADRVASRVYLHRDCMAAKELKERQAEGRRKRLLNQN